MIVAKAHRHTCMTHRRSCIVILHKHDDKLRDKYITRITHRQNSDVIMSKIDDMLLKQVRHQIVIFGCRRVLSTAYIDLRGCAHGVFLYDMPQLQKVSNNSCVMEWSGCTLPRQSCAEESWCTPSDTAYMHGCKIYIRNRYTLYPCLLLLSSIPNVLEQNFENEAISMRGP